MHGICSLEVDTSSSCSSGLRQQMVKSQNCFENVIASKMLEQSAWQSLSALNWGKERWWTSEMSSTELWVCQDTWNPWNLTIVFISDLKSSITTSRVNYPVSWNSSKSMAVQNHLQIEKIHIQMNTHQHLLGYLTMKQSQELAILLLNEKWRWLPCNNQVTQNDSRPVMTWVLLRIGTWFLFPKDLLLSQCT